MLTSGINSAHSMIEKPKAIMTNNPYYFTIITPVFNRREQVVTSIKSSLRFLLECGVEGEVIVVDDASSDGSAEHVEAIFHDNITRGNLQILRIAGNAGVTAARQMGIGAAQGDWILMMDSDDMFVEGCGRAVANILKTIPGRCPIVFFRCSNIESGQIVGEAQTQTIDLSISQLLRSGTPGECLPAIRREALMAEPYDEDLRGFELLTYARIARHFGPVRVVPTVVRGYCSDDGGDRLSTRRAIRRRGCLLALGYVRMLRLFWRELGLSAIPVLARIGYHCTNCLIISYSKWFPR